MLAGAALSLAGNAINSKLSQGASDDAFARQKDLMRLQNQYAIDNWERQVSYNDPKAQMQRLRDAGLNPNLVYGSGSVGLESPSIAPPSAPSAPMQVTSPANYQSVLSDAVQAAVGIQQAKKAGSEAIGQDIENKYLEKSLNDRLELVATENRWKKQDVERVKEQTAILQQQFASVVADLNLKQLDADERRVRLNRLEDFLDAQLREYRDKHNLSALEYRQAELMADDVRRQLKANADTLELQYQIGKQYSETEKRLGMVGQIVSWLFKAGMLFKN